MTQITTPAGNTFVLLGTRPYTRRDGAVVQVEDWQGHCRKEGCGAPFLVTAPAGSAPSNSKAFGAVHCADHKLTRSECMVLANASRKARKKNL